MNRQQRRQKKPRTGRRATMVDVRRAKKESRDLALETCWAIFFTALRDKEGFTNADLRRVWDEVNYLADSVTNHYINVNDLVRALDNEAGITLTHRRDDNGS